jgi:flavin reductase (DIM6/NTAB) family NADH-FMN oxidoreductase RutF
MYAVMNNKVASPPIMDPALFKAVSSHWPSGVAVITAASADGGLYGLTMSAVMSLSIDPMQFLISVDKKSTTLPVIKSSERFCINFLNKSQGEIGMQLASKASDKFANVKHRISSWGPPTIDGAIACITCAVNVVHSGGDHEIVVGDVLDIEHHGGEPLVHFMRAFHTVTAA